MSPEDGLCLPSPTMPPGFPEVDSVVEGDDVPRPFQNDANRHETTRSNISFRKGLKPKGKLIQGKVTPGRCESM